MSYILEALKKAEQERDRGRVPRLETLHDNAPRRSRALPWISAGILLVNAAALVWWLRPGTHPEVTAAPPQASPLRIAPAVPAPPPVTHRPPPAVLAPPVVIPQVTSIPPPAPVATPVAPVEPAPVAAPPAAPKVALLRDLPADFRATVPSLNLDVHVYAPNAASRFVLINMKKYHEGDQLAEGPRIEEITENGAVLSYQGQKFRLAR